MKYLILLTALTVLPGCLVTSGDMDRLEQDVRGLTADFVAGKINSTEAIGDLKLSIKEAADRPRERVEAAVDTAVKAAPVLAGSLGIPPELVAGLIALVTGTIAHKTAKNAATKEAQWLVQSNNVQRDAKYMKKEAA